MLPLFYLWSLGTACSDKDYCSSVLCLESEAKKPLPFFSRILRHAREGLCCKHILRRPARWENIRTFAQEVFQNQKLCMCDMLITIDQAAKTGVKQIINGYYL